MRFLKPTTGEKAAPAKRAARAGLTVAFIGMAAACWLLPARAQDHGAPPPPPPKAAPHGTETPPPPPGASHGETPAVQGEHGTAAPHAPDTSSSAPGERGSHQGAQEPGPGGSHGPVTGGTHEVGEPAGGHGAEGAHGAPDSHGTAGEHGEAGGHGAAGGHGEEHAEAESDFDIHLKTWLYGPLQQIWFNGPATLNAEGAVGADGQPVAASSLQGQKVDYEYDYHHKKFSTHPTIGTIGHRTPGPTDKVETINVGGQQVTFVNPTVNFPLQGWLSEGLVMSLITAILLAVVLFLLTRDLRRIPTRKQTLLEMAYSALDGFVGGLIGPGYQKYLPLIGAAFIYIFFMNIGILFPGWGAATANINVTAGLAIVIVVYVQIEGLRANGLKGYLMHFVGDPWWLGPLNFPIHLIGEVARVLSLSIRLFGNIFGEDTVIVILILLSVKFFAGGLIPGQFPMYFLALFTGAVQAMVFCILSCVYIALMTVHDHEEHHHAHGHEDDHGHIEPEIHAPAPAV